MNSKSLSGRIMQKLKMNSNMKRYQLQSPAMKNQVIFKEQNSVIQEVTEENKAFEESKNNDSVLNSSTLNHSQVQLKEENKEEIFNKKSTFHRPHHSRVRSTGSELSVFTNSFALGSTMNKDQNSLKNEGTLTSSIFSTRNLMNSFHFRARSVSKTPLGQNQMSTADQQQIVSQLSNVGGFLSNLIGGNGLQRTQRSSNSIQPNSLLEQQNGVKMGAFKFGDSSIAAKFNEQKMRSLTNSRICLEKLGPELLQPNIILSSDSPICEPCKCMGSIKFIHKECLKEWVKWANENNLRVNPNDPTQFELQVMQFNKKYRLSKILILAMLLLFILVLMVDLLSAPLRYNVNSEVISQGLASDTFGEVNRLTLITIQDDVNDIFADEEMPRFNKFNVDYEEQKVSSNNINISKDNNKQPVAGVIPPVRLS
ncbi:probable e3 ubiquitin-protein ligase march10 [Stylonychia lemnae]|uniref:Probable e3 ubiquitin-protein ligase march10 n=1 Tax=Stylonychia lemnae TaxID=5949 RepID=A0A078A2C9_STYLE|nr:probable e3 ubiquitin-protein ligase march10 [Stylonychia lemnae]|eukprot:CDW76290.1 probable e3 ubiquitin-protein ligase march10 [Stylonychia lemnae]